MKLKKLTTDDYLSVVENYRMFDIKAIVLILVSKRCVKELGDIIMIFL